MRSPGLLLLLVFALSSARAGVFSDQRPAIEASINRALDQLSRTQQPNGSFPGSYGNHSGVVGLAGMAFLSMGHMPGEGPYGRSLNRCVDYVLGTQTEAGVFSGGGGSNMYSHCLATLFLSEVSGCVSAERQKKLHVAVAKGLSIIIRAQAIRKNPRHQGGWRYNPSSRDSDLSVSGWAIMALRSARLNGAPVPDAAIDSAIHYVMKMYSRADHSFGYSSPGGGSPSMTAVGILCLELTGKHGHPIIEPAGRLLLDRLKTHRHRSHGAYSNYYFAQAMFQIGGDYWETYAGLMYPHYLQSQHNDGSWGSRSHNLGQPANLDKRKSGPVHETAMTVLALSVPFRQLPIYQRDATLDSPP